MASDKPFIACALCTGDAPEPYLAATLASISDAVDFLVVNDNSGLTASPNVVTLEASPFAGERLHLVQRPFVDFATMRNDAFAPLRDLARTPDWVLFLDADEVHGEQLAYLARDVLPRLGDDIGRLDAYTFHFWGTFGWISDVARRMVFYRFARELRWVNAIHEELQGVRGRTIVVSYIYHHYGNVLAPRALAEKHQRYYALGNKVPEPPAPSAADLEIYLSRASAIRPFRAAHPAAARSAVAEISTANAAMFEAIDAGFRARRTALDGVRGAIAAANETLRVRLRTVEHPGLYRASTIAR